MLVALHSRWKRRYSVFQPGCRRSDQGGPAFLLDKFLSKFLYTNDEIFTTLINLHKSSRPIFLMIIVFQNKKENIIKKRNFRVA